MQSKNERYSGRIATVLTGERYGFIGIDSVLQDDGTDHDIQTTADIFVHQDECAAPLTVGMTVSFEVVADARRGEGHFRAIGVTEAVEAEAVPDTDPIVRHFSAFQLVPAGAARATGTTNALTRPIPPHPWAARMKPVPDAVVAKTVANGPLPHTARDEGAVASDDPRVVAALQAFLAHEFPHLAGLDLGYDVINVDGAAFDARARDAVGAMRDLGMNDQATDVAAEVARFRGTRNALGYLLEQNLLRRNTFISTQYLPDLFMAVPVWYFAVDDQGMRTAAGMSTADDPKNHPATIAICDVLPGNLRWADTFQMFNRRLRPLSAYRGDIIPTALARLIREARGFFDHVVIATPYHDVAGKDWGDLAWLRSIDPYVLGFQKGCSHFFVLGRFSDSGVFPLYHELVADTIEFLRAKREQLRGFNNINNPYWYVANTGAGVDQSHGQRRPVAGQGTTLLGNHLMEHTNQLLRAFDAGRLFDWLRGEWSENMGDHAVATMRA